MSKKWVIIIVIIILTLLVWSYFWYRYYTKYAITEYDAIINCYKNIDNCRISYEGGANIICPICCDKNGEEIFDGTRLEECIERN